MRLTQRFGITLLLVFAVVQTWAQQHSQDVVPPTSLIRVIANPENFAGKRIRVIGVLNYGGGLDRSVCLYVSEPDARNSVMSNCIFVNKSFDTKDERLGKYVILNATVQYVSNHSEWDSLSFEDVSDIRLWPSYQK
jgi:hypothetical protein